MVSGVAQLRLVDSGFQKREEPIQKSNVFCKKHPIIVERKSKVDVAISFHKSFFSTPFVEDALCVLCCGEVWDLFKVDTPPKDIYAKYILTLQKDFGDKNDGILLTVVSRAIKEVYWSEMRASDKDFEINKLLKPYSSLKDSLVISRRTEVALKQAGISTIGDLANMTREDFYDLPGITGEELVKLEKNLILCGLYLMPSIKSFP